jgi:hypothetical protein
VTSDIVVRDNVFFGNASSARQVTIRGPGNTVAGNKFYNINNAGIASGVLQVISAVTKFLRIEGNAFSGCRGGIYVGDNAGDGAVISGNTFTNPVSTTTPFVNIVAGANHIITDNTMDANGTAVPGIVIQTTAGDGHTISGNIGTAFTALIIDVGRGYCQIISNTLQSTNALGCIRLESATAVRNNVRWNYCDATGNARTILLTNNAAYNVIQENMLVGSGALVRDETNGVNWPTANGTISTPNDRSTNAFRVPLTGRSLGAQTVGASQATIAHGLPWTPREVRIRMTSTGMIWESAAADATNIYLTADDANRTCEVTVL